MAKDPDPSKFDDPTRLRAIIGNARRKGREDLVMACMARIAELAGQEFDDAVEREFWEAVTVAEEIKTLERGRTTRLSLTRRKHTKNGARKCVDDLAAKTETTDGFATLVAAERADLTFEAITLRHPQSFSEETLIAATKKLADADVNTETIKRGAS